MAPSTYSCPHSDSCRHANGSPSPTNIATFPGLTELWAETVGDPRICIAVLDGPVDLTHPSLARASLRHIEKVGSVVAANGSAAEHGTHIASVIFGRHDGPVKGIAPTCRGMTGSIFQNAEDGSIAACSQKELAEALRKAVEAGAHVINVSAGQLTDPTSTTLALAEAIRYCESNERLIIAAAGNDGCAECLHVPGAMPSDCVLAVGAMDWEGEPLELSNWGEIYRSQGILAPGYNIEGAMPGGNTSIRSGTSFATAITAGVVGLLLSLQLKRGQRPNVKAVRTALLRSALGCTHRHVNNCDRLLAGRLNITGAMSLLFRPQGVVNVTTQIQTHDTDARLVQPQEMPHMFDQANDADMSRSLDAPASASRLDCAHISPAGPDTATARVSSPPTPLDSRRPVMNSISDPSGLNVRGLLPSGCGCGGNGTCGCGKGIRQVVYAIGERLDYDFGTRVREQSIQENFSSGVLDIGLRQDSLRMPANLLRHLLGWDGSTGVPGTSGAARGFNGNLYDVKAIQWVLYQDDCPQYVIRPEGVFADVAYKELLYFFIENAGIRLYEHGISHDCLDEYFKCHGGLSEPLESRPTQAEGHADDKSSKRPKTSEGAKGAPADKADESADSKLLAFGSLLGEPPGKVARIAVAGEIVGKAQISTGEVLEVISPDLRGMASWNTERLLEEVGELVSDNAAALTVVGRLVSTLYEETRNDGKSPEDRAKNWTVTSMLRVIRAFFANPVFASMLGGLQNAAVSDVTVRPSACRRTGLEFDVDVVLYSFENTLRGQLVLTMSVDVSDVVPVTLGRVRTSTRR